MFQPNSNDILNHPERLPVSKPVRISSKLGQFLNLDCSKQYYKPDISKLVCDYIKQHKLQDQKDKRIVWPDKKLQEMLQFPTCINYFTLQKYLNVHYRKIKNPHIFN